jgi:hypothetical protein
MSLTIHRSRDRYYKLFLLSFIPTILFFDAQPLYPPNLVPTILSNIQSWYFAVFNDQLLARQPPWFHFFALTEIFYQFPAAVYIVYSLHTRSPGVAPHTIIWATISTFTTATCLYEIYHDAVMTNTQKLMLGGMYGVYGAICKPFRRRREDEEVLTSWNSCGDGRGYVLPGTKCSEDGFNAGGGEEGEVGATNAITSLDLRRWWANGMADADRRYTLVHDMYSRLDILNSIGPEYEQKLP